MARTFSMGVSMGGSRPGMNTARRLPSRSRMVLSFACAAPQSHTSTGHVAVENAAALRGLDGLGEIHDVVHVVIFAPLVGIEQNAQQRDADDRRCLLRHAASVRRGSTSSSYMAGETSEATGSAT